MPSPRHKPVSTDVMRRIANAIEELAARPDLPRTKRSLEALTGLSHDAVARAFRQDSNEDNDYRLNARLKDLLAPGTTGRRSPTAEEQHQTEQTVRELRHANRDLQLQLDRYAMALYAYALSTGTLVSTDSSTELEQGPIPIRRQRRQPTSG